MRCERLAPAQGGWSATLRDAARGLDGAGTRGGQRDRPLGKRFRQRARLRCVPRTRCASSRAATSSCRDFSRTASPIFSRTRTGASCSPFPTSTTTRCSARPMWTITGPGRRCGSTRRRSPICVRWPTATSRQQITPADVVWSYSGVRPLLADESSDPMSVTRDYALELDRDAGAVAVRVRRQDHHVPQPVGGCRRPACQALGVRAAPWTVRALLPGGDVPEGSFAVFLRAVERRYPWLPQSVRLRWAHAYGTRIERVVGNAQGVADAAEELLPQLYEREVQYLCHEEFARSADDILWRRSKLGLRCLNTDDRDPADRWQSTQPRYLREPRCRCSRCERAGPTSRNRGNPPCDGGDDSGGTRPSVAGRHIRPHAVDTGRATRGGHRLAHEPAG